jgi:hypothetical protein
MTPWQRLQEWEMCDKGRRESTREYITARLQEQWPGNYRVERVGARHVGWPVTHAIVFDDPAEETMFRLRWA